MRIRILKFKLTVGAICALMLTSPALAQTPNLDPLFDALSSATAEEAPLIEQKIRVEWEKSGSPAMDYMLRRAQMAMQEGEYKEALNDLVAATDHAPEFAEAWHLQAVSYAELGAVGPAMDALETTLSLEPRHFPAMRGLMFLLEESDLTDQALRVADMILAIHPHADDISTVKERLQAKTAGSRL